MSRSRSGVVDRRTFVKDAALMAAAAGGLSAGLGGLSGLLAQPSAVRAGLRGLRVDGQTRPFNIVCLGDSVMWGQGLQESTKFTWLIKNWLQDKMPGRPVNRFVYARSGATLVPDKEVPDESHVAEWMNNPNLGEVPCSWPWVRQQVVVARNNLTSQQISNYAVDLVLLDGGINDLGVFGTLLVATNNPDDIRTRSATYCRGHMLEVMGRVRDTFPNAKILVTGYFPVVSRDSNLDALAVLLALVVPFAGLPVNSEIKSKLVTLSDTWYDASNTDLAAAVTAFNNRWAAASSVSSRTPPATFARIPWSSEHSYAAPNARLYTAGLPNDPVYWQRLDACAKAGGGKAGSPLCLDAKIGHPNASGAVAYANACKAQLNAYLPEWLNLKQMAACVEMDPMPSVGVPTSLTVYATTEGPTGRMRVPATVRIGGATYRSDTPLPVTLCTSSRTISVDRSGTRPVREAGERVVTCAPITVSAAGYADVVVQD